MNNNFGFTIWAPDGVTQVYKSETHYSSRYEARRAAIYAIGEGYSQGHRYGIYRRMEGQ